MLDGVQLSKAPDTFTWRLWADGQYSMASAYGAMFLGSSPMLGAKELGQTAAPARVCFFFWLCLQERCWAANRRFLTQSATINMSCVTKLRRLWITSLLGCSISRQVCHVWLARSRGGTQAIPEGI